MNKQLELVKEFQEAFKQPVLSKEDEIPIERRKLRLALLFEELTELADAYGLKTSFNKILFEHLNSETILEPGFMNLGVSMDCIEADTEILNKKEVLDATCDLQYILSGTILENGQHEVFDPAFEDVHLSNMSKLCKGTRETEETIANYMGQGIEVYEEPCGKYMGVFRKSDKKILKSINYKPVELEKYV
jgi:predicted HAD superfamily Cof-like phosphohydrolase